MESQTENLPGAVLSQLIKDSRCGISDTSVALLSFWFQEDYLALAITLASAFKTKEGR